MEYAVIKNQVVLKRFAIKADAINYLSNLRKQLCSAGRTIFFYSKAEIIVQKAVKEYGIDGYNDVYSVETVIGNDVI